MNDLAQLMTFGDSLALKVVAFSLLLCFTLTMVIAAVYVWTFRGMSYSRSFVQAVALGSIVSAMLMLAINNNIAAGLGIAGSLAIIRFRTAMRDPRDMVFVFASLGTGIATGLRSYGPAIIGVAVFCLAALLLTVTEFGTQRRFDGLLRLQVPAGEDAEVQLAKILRRHTRQFVLVTLREVAQGNGFEHAYQVRLPHLGARSALVQALNGVDGVSSISLLLQEPTVEL